MESQGSIKAVRSHRQAYMCVKMEQAVKPSIIKCAVQTPISSTENVKVNTKHQINSINNWYVIVLINAITSLHWRN
jgi:hypothetical protein